MANPLYGSNKVDKKLDEASQRTVPNLVGTDLAEHYLQFLQVI